MEDGGTAFTGCKAVKLENNGRGLDLHEVYFGERRTLLVKNVLEDMLSVLLHP